MGYFTWKEDESYRDGYNDGRCGRRDHFRDEHFGNDADKAYYDGLKEAEREEERRQERREEERQQEQMELRQEQARRERCQAEEDYYMQMSEQEYVERMHQEPRQNDPNDDLPF